MRQSTGAAAGRATARQTRPAGLREGEPSRPRSRPRREVAPARGVRAHRRALTTPMGPRSASASRAPAAGPARASPCTASNLNAPRSSPPSRRDSATLSASRPARGLGRAPTHAAGAPQGRQQPAPPTTSSWPGRSSPHPQLPLAQTVDGAVAGARPPAPTSRRGGPLADTAELRARRRGPPPQPRTAHRERR